jgi:hypothetical protein
MEVFTCSHSRMAGHCLSKFDKTHGDKVTPRSAEAKMCDTVILRLDRTGVPGVPSENFSPDLKFWAFVFVTLISLISVIFQDMNIRMQLFMRDRRQPLFITLEILIGLDKSSRKGG